MRFNFENRYYQTHEIQKAQFKRKHKNTNKSFNQTVNKLIPQHITPEKLKVKQIKNKQKTKKQQMNKLINKAKYQ